MNKDFDLASRTNSFDKAEQRRLDAATKTFDKNSERRQRTYRKEETKLKEELRKLNEDKELSRRSVDETRSFLRNVKAAEKAADQATGRTRRRHSVGIATQQGVKQLKAVRASQEKRDGKTVAHSQEAAQSIVATAMRDVAKDEERSIHFCLKSQDQESIQGTSTRKSSASSSRHGGLRQENSARIRRQQLQMSSMPGMRKPSITFRPPSGQKDKLATISHPGFRLRQDPTPRRDRKQQIAELEALLHEGELSLERQEMLDQWIKVLSNSEDILSDPESSFDPTSDGKVALSTSKRSQLRRLSTLEDLMNQYLPSLRTHKSPPPLTALEALSCSYLRLPPSVVDELEEQCRSEGIDHGVHPHMTEERVEKYFSGVKQPYNDTLNQKDIDSTGDESSH